MRLVSPRWWLLGLAACLLLTACAPPAWLLRGAMGRATLTRAAVTAEGVVVLGSTSALARAAAASGLSVTESLAIRGATSSLLRGSPLRLTTARSVPVSVYQGERLLLQGTLERQGGRVTLRDPSGAAIRVEADGANRVQFWNVHDELAGEAMLEGGRSVLRAVNGQPLGSDELGEAGELVHYGPDGREFARSRVSFTDGTPQLTLRLETGFSALLEQDLSSELSATSSPVTAEPARRPLPAPVLYVGGNLTEWVLPALNGFNAEADQRFVSSIVRHGGPSWATQRELLNIAALSVDGDCRPARSLPQARVCAVAIAYRAPARPSFHLRDECPGASEAQALETCVARMQDELRTRLRGAGGERGEETG